MLRCCSVVKGGLRVHLIPKVAHSAIAYAIGEKQIGQRVEPDEPSEDIRMMVVRHPLDRIVSAWSFFCKERTDAAFNDGMSNLGYYREMSFDEFLNHLLEHYNKNVHTIKQIDFAGGNEIELLIPMEKLSSAWPCIAKTYRLSTFREDRANKSKHEDWQMYYSEGQRNKAEQVFEEDLDLYNLALEKYNG